MLDRSFIDDYEKSAGKIGQMIQGLTVEDLQAFPIPGSWSIQQVVLHLADSELVFADRIKRVIAEENPSLLAFNQDKWSANLHYDAQSAEDASKLVELTRKQLIRVLRALPESAFERSGVHSEAGKLSLRAIIEKASSHFNHHVKFIVDKREKLGKMMW